MPRLGFNGRNGWAKAGTVLLLGAGCSLAEVPGTVEENAIGRSDIRAAPIASHPARPTEEYGPAAAIEFELKYRGADSAAGELYCYPAAAGIPFDDTKNIIAMNGSLWTPTQLAADFQRRMASIPAGSRKKGIIVVLKTERCATKMFRACSVTTAALEKRSTPLVAEFLIYGVWLKPRDHDDPPGRLKIESEADAWKNEAAGEYQFRQGPGATMAFIDPETGAVIARTDAARMGLYEKDFLKNDGKTPEFEAELRIVLEKLSRRAGRGA